VRPTTTPTREAEIRAWAAGKFSDGTPHIPEDVASFTRDLLAMLDEARGVGLYTKPAWLIEAEAWLGQLRAAVGAEGLEWLPPEVDRVHNYYDLETYLSWGNGLSIEPRLISSEHISACVALYRRCLRREVGNEHGS